jgi:hypothetical protein
VNDVQTRESGARVRSRIMGSVGTKFYRSMRKRLYRNGRLEYQQSERENMKTYLKYSIMIALTLMMTIGLVKAQPQPIGTTTWQTNPWESNPSTVTENTMYGVTSPANMYDGRLSTEGYFQLADNDADTWVQLTGFDQPASLFTITWVDLKINFKVDSGIYDDTWRVEWTVGANPWQVLIPDQVAKPFDTSANPQTTVWSQRIEPTDGSWSWTDINNIKVRFYTTAGADGMSDWMLLHIYEVWATVYSSPVPSVGMSIQPPNVNALVASRRFFIDIYVQGVVNMAGYQLRVYFDTLYLQPLAGGWSYYPFNDQSAADDLNDALGYCEISYTIPIANPLSGTGVSGNYPIARLYFITTTGIPSDWYSWFRFTVSFMGDNEATKLSHNVYHGSYGTLPALTYLVGSDPVQKPSLFPYENPISTHWTEEFPNPGDTWHLTSWTDNGVPPYVLDASDQIDMTPVVPSGPVQWFHVDQIWECDADPNTFAFMILTWKEGPVPEFPLGLGILMMIAPATAVIYLWRRKKVTKP